MYLNWRWDTILVKPWMGDYEGPGRLTQYKGSQNGLLSTIAFTALE